MKKLVTKVVTICDYCQKEADYARPCMTCQKEMCYTCREKEAVEYPHAVSVSGSGDGLYCKACDAAHMSSGTNAKHSAYLVIQRLRKESRDFYEDFRIRSASAELDVQNLPAA